MITESPKRLLEQGDGVAELLEQALEGYERGLDPRRALWRLQARKTARPAFRGWLLAAAVTTASIGLLLLRPWQNPEKEA
ncbi:MAG TPA: hypothetical protein VNG33_01445, partial [Polyangiaceae bacterium]|nr:hypothetical protein [Polyangiaceae bacterium]